MLVTFYCEHCNSKLRTNADAMGSVLHCPECEKAMTVPQQPFGEGYVIGGFLIKQKIGQGGMGEVYLARQLSMQRDVALKILPPQFTRQSNFVVRFLKEVHFQARLDHTNIVTAYEAGEDSGVYYMAMAYVQGETLEEILERDGVLSEELALSIIEQAAEALAYAWEEHGLLHRDIKPGNIMLQNEKKAKLLDLGLSKSVHDTRGTTQADTLMGTPNYMSPEQVDNPQDVGPHSDMYALGMTLYHMLCGVIPFEDTSYMKVLKRHGSEQLEDPRNLMPGISSATTRLLAWVLAREPEHRPSTWADFIQAVRSASAGQAAIIPEPSGDSTLNRDRAADPVAEDPKGFLTSLPKPPPIAIAIGLGLVVGILGILLLKRRLAEPEPIEPPIIPVSATATPTPLPAATPTPPLYTIAEQLNNELADILLEYESKSEFHDQTVTSLLQLAEKAKGSSVSPKIMEQVIRIRKDRETLLTDERKVLKRRVVSTLNKKGAVAAKLILSQYSHPYIAELRPTIRALQTQIQQYTRQQELDEEAKRQTAIDTLLELENRVAPLLMKLDLNVAADLLETATTSDKYDSIQAELQSLIREVDALREIPAQVIAGFTKDVGEEIQLELRDGSMRVTVSRVFPSSILVERNLRSENGDIIGSTEFELSYLELHPREVMRRLQANQSHAGMLFKGILANQNGSTDTAIHFLRAAGRPFGTQMASQLEMLAIPLDLPSLDFTPELIKTNSANDGLRPRRARDREARPIRPNDRTPLPELRLRPNDL